MSELWHLSAHLRLLVIAFMFMHNQAPPIFKTSLKEFHVKFGDEAQLQCLAQGDVPIKFAWYKNDKLIQDSQER